MCWIIYVISTFSTIISSISSCAKLHVTIRTTSVCSQILTLVIDGTITMEGTPIFTVLLGKRLESFSGLIIVDIIKSLLVVRMSTIIDPEVSQIISGTKC